MTPQSISIGIPEESAPTPFLSTTSSHDGDHQSPEGFIPAAWCLRCGSRSPFCCDHSRQWEVNPKRMQAQSPPPPVCTQGLHIPDGALKSTSNTDPDFTPALILLWSPVGTKYHYRS